MLSCLRNDMCLDSGCLKHITFFSEIKCVIIDVLKICIHKPYSIVVDVWHGKILFNPQKNARIDSFLAFHIHNSLLSKPCSIIQSKETWSHLQHLLGFLDDGLCVLLHGGCELCKVRAHHFHRLLRLTKHNVRIHTTDQLTYWHQSAR